MNSKPNGVCAPEGFYAGAAFAGVKASGTKDDVAILYSSTPCSAAAVYTSNKVKADCLQVTKEHIAAGNLQAVVVNSGNANAVAPNGYANAVKTADAAAAKLHLSPDQIAVASTGVIGVELPAEKIVKAIDKIELSKDGSDAAAHAIMTTDTKEKTAVETFTVSGVTCTMGAICKGSGMIHPNMGTMLCFITTDAAIDPALLEKALQKAVKRTFNCVSVDGDTSTNDMCLVMANGQAKNPEITAEDEDYAEFYKALYSIMEKMAIAIASDGEGASRLMTVTVKNAKEERQAYTLARSVACSTLFKAALFGKDANWGRVVCALGYADTDFDVKGVDITFESKAGSLPVFINGLACGFDEEHASKVLGEDAVTVLIDLHKGEQECTCWGCDLTYDYVRINGDYRT